MLYRMPYDADIAKIIVSASTVDMLKNIFDLLNLEDSRHNSDYHKEHDTFQVSKTRIIKKSIYVFNFNLRTILYFSEKAQAFRYGDVESIFDEFQT